MPTGFSLPHDTPLIKQAKINSVITSNVSVSLSSVLRLSNSFESNSVILLVQFHVAKSHTFSFICPGQVQGGL